MSMSIDLNSEQVADLERTLARLNMRELALPVFKAIGLEITGKAKVYPPATIANSPSNPSGHWYERGFGTRFASGASYQTSERLGDRWFSMAFPDYVRMGNVASYAGYVHGEEQAGFHKDRGWKRLVKVIEDELDEVIRKLEAQVMRIWEGRQ